MLFRSVNADANLQENADNGDRTAIKDMIRRLKAQVSFIAFKIWIDILRHDTLTSMITPIISYLTDVYINRVPENARNDDARLVDMIRCLATLVDDQCDKVIDGKCVVTDDLAAEKKENYRYSA